MPSYDTDTTAELIRTHCNAISVEYQQFIQSVWSGYGAIERYLVHYSNHTEHVVLKRINKEAVSSHPRGWNNDFAHQRKQDSYRNELLFYSQYNVENTAARTAGLKHHFETDSHHYLLLEDLSHSGFITDCNYETNHIESALQWLANFHAFWIDKSTPDLWPKGNYWHLATRPMEFEAMAESPLKQAASKIDQTLSAARFKTLIHGDAKLANFLFNQQSAAAVDFQYVGRGIGSSDFVYFIGSVFTEQQLEYHYSDYTRLYFSYLESALKQNGFDQTEALIEEWQNLLSMAWADFQRFIAGWKPGHKKDHSFSHKQTEIALAALREKES